MTDLSPDDVRLETWAVAAGRPAAEPGAPLNPAPILASTFIADGEFAYGRYGNPTWTAFEQTLGGLEGGRALAFASGMAATAAILDAVVDGGAVVMPAHAYLGSLALAGELAERGRIELRQVDIADTDAVVAALDGAALLWIESPTNPALEVADVPALAAAARDRGIRSVLDSTFATPVLQRGLELGVDVVLHSATKFISGHSDVVMGAIVTRDDALLERLDGYRRLHGAIPSPFDVFLALRGLRTLPLRVERAQQNARDLAARLAGHPALDAAAASGGIRYPGFGAILAVELPDAARADAFVAAVRLARHATSLGGVETTLERRRRWSGEAPSIPEGLVRISVGVEHVDDLERDLATALDAAR